jgi:hypothetical protein
MPAMMGPNGSQACRWALISSQQPVGKALHSAPYGGYRSDSDAVVAQCPQTVLSEALTRRRAIGNAPSVPACGWPSPEVLCPKAVVCPLEVR